MTVKLTGVQNFDSVKLNDGGILDGTKVHFTYFSPKVKGFAADKKFLSRELLNAFGITNISLETSIGSDIGIDYGPNSEVVGVSVAIQTEPVKPNHVQEKLK
jgi:hypothetical protein